MARRYTFIVCLSLVVATLLPCAARAAFPGVNGRIQFSREGNSGAAHIYSIDPSGHNERQLTLGLKALDEDGSWSPDGTRIVFQRCSDPSFTSCGVVVMNADGSGGSTLTPIDAGNIDDYPVFSPDGSKIAFLRQTGASCCDLMVMNADGSDVHSIRAMYNSTTVDGPSWSPDGARIAYIDPTGSLAVTNADGSGTSTPLHSPSSGYDETSDWSPDGTRIVFSAAGTNSGGYYRIWSVPSDGSAPATELDPSDDTAHEDEPSFSPDGTKILFERDDSVTHDEPIYVENADGSGAVRVTGEDDYAYRATWQPLHPAPPAPPPPPAPRPPFAGISLVTHALTVSSKGIALISESCPAATNGSCTGTLTLKTAGRVAAVAKHRKVKRRIVTLGRGKFSIPAGQTAKVRVRLTKAAFAILRSNGKLRAVATVVSHDASGAAKTKSGKLTLRAPKARRRPHHRKGHR